MRNVALDLGVREISFCEVAQGKVVQRRTVRSLDALDDLLGPDSPPAKVAVEACREAWVVHDKLRAWGHEVLLVDTTRSRQLGIGQHGRKTDRIDAEHMARAVERGGIPLAHVLSPHRRAIREQMAVRRALVETRAQYVVTIRGLLRARGERVKTCAIDDFLVALDKATMSAESRTLVAPLATMLSGLNFQIAQCDVALEKLCAEEPAIERLMTAPGVGMLVAAAFVSVVDEAKRFRNAHQVASYVGLVPFEDTSGGREKRRLGSITKHGNAYLRALLVQAAHTILRCGPSDDPMRAWGRAVVERRDYRIGVVAVARRLAGVLWAMWRDGTVYDGKGAATASSKRRRVATQSSEVAQEARKRVAHKMRARERSIRKGLGVAANPRGRDQEKRDAMN
ncbi:IS110 family transposase [Polyangium fumosum]|nr:IS110 family transposase [Polyangium fumosum]